MEIEEVKELIKTLDNSNLTYLSLKNKSGSIELRKEDSVVAPIDIPVSRSAAAPKQPDFDWIFVKSPIVGIAYKSPKPGAEPFVQTGQKVKTGQTLCIVEAMKMLNEIKADTSGVVSEILFEDGKLVEFDMPLFKIEANGTPERL